MQTVDQQKEEFQRYLEKSGVLDSITRMLQTLNDMPEKPEDARDFIREFMTSVGPSETSVLQLKIDELTKELKDKNDEIEALQGMLKSKDAGSSDA